MQDTTWIKQIATIQTAFKMRAKPHRNKYGFLNFRKHDDAIKQINYNNNELKFRRRGATSDTFRRRGATSECSRQCSAARQSKQPTCEMERKGCNTKNVLSTHTQTPQTHAIYDSNQTKSFIFKRISKTERSPIWKNIHEIQKKDYAMTNMYNNNQLAFGRRGATSECFRRRAAMSEFEFVVIMHVWIAYSFFIECQESICCPIGLR